MEYLGYANMVAANDGETINTECYLPQSAIQLKKSFKSACLSFASIGVLLPVAVQSQIASAYYVDTNGSCLNVRVGPSLDAPVVNCLSNGAPLPPIVWHKNGFVKLISEHWVSDDWISQTPSCHWCYYHSSYSHGDGGQYPSYFRHHHRRHHHSYEYSSYHYPEHHHSYEYSSYHYPEHHHSYEYSSYHYPEHHYSDDYSSYHYPEYHHSDDYSSYHHSSSHYPEYHHSDDYSSYHYSKHHHSNDYGSYY